MCVSLCVCLWCVCVCGVSVSLCVCLWWDCVCLSVVWVCEFVCVSVVWVISRWVTRDSEGTEKHAHKCRVFMLMFQGKRKWSSLLRTHHRQHGKKNWHWTCVRQEAVGYRVSFQQWLFLFPQFLGFPVRYLVPFLWRSWCPLVSLLENAHKHYSTVTSSYSLITKPNSLCMECHSLITCNILIGSYPLLKQQAAHQRGFRMSHALMMSKSLKIWKQMRRVTHILWVKSTGTDSIWPRMHIIS